MEAVGWADVPRELRCIVLSFLSPKEICMSVALVAKSFHEAASHDDVWRYLCQRNFPHHETEIEPSFSHLLGELKGNRVQCKSEVVCSSVPWKEKFKLYTRRLFVLHHKYNDINEGALEDALNKWKDAGAIITDIRASTDDFLEPRVTEWIAEIRKIMRRHRVVYLFTDGGMKDWLRHPIGDALADFVEEGNVVIIGTFSNVAKRERPGGRWETEDYNPITSESQLNSQHDLGKVFQPEHPIMRGVTKLNAMYKAVGKIHPKALSLAAYDHTEEYVLVAEMPVNFASKKGLVVSVNIYLPSSDSPLVGWKNAEGNQVVLLHGNILRYAMKFVCSQ